MKLILATEIKLKKGSLLCLYHSELPVILLFWTTSMQKGSQ